MIFPHNRYDTLRCLSSEDKWCLNPLDPEDFWTSLDLVSRGCKTWVKVGPVAEVVEALDPGAPWPAPIWTL